MTERTRISNAAPTTSTVVSDVPWDVSASRAEAATQVLAKARARRPVAAQIAEPIIPDVPDAEELMQTRPAAAGPAPAPVQSVKVTPASAPAPQQNRRHLSKQKLRICFTGHRPDKLGGFNARSHRRAVDAIKHGIENLAETQGLTVTSFVLHSGGALGGDQAAEQAAIELNISFIRFVPCQGHSSRWQPAQVRQSEKLGEQAIQTVMVDEGPYAAWKMQKRNEAMLRTADVVLALWDGSEGGTGNCVTSAREMGVPVRCIWPLFEGNAFSGESDESAYWIPVANSRRGVVDVAGVLRYEPTNSEESVFFA